MATEITVMIRSRSAPYLLWPLAPSGIVGSFTVGNMRQLVRIPNDINPADPAAHDLEGDGENFSICQSCHASREPVDHRWTQVDNGLHAFARQTGEKCNDPGASDDRIES